MRRADPSPDAEAIASAIRDAADPSGLETIADAIGDAFASADGGKASVTDGLLAIARALARIAEVMEKP